MKTLMDTLASRVFGPLDRLRTGDESFRYVDEVEAFNQLPADAIRKHALDRIRAVCTVANRCCPFYTERFKAAGITRPEALSFEEFQTLPLLTRNDILQNQEGLINQEMGRNALRASATGGSTSAPVPFYMDYNAFYRRRSATIVFDRWFGYSPGASIAYLWGAERDFRDQTTLKGKWRKRLVDRDLFLYASPLDETIMMDHYHKLQEARPVLLQGYPTALAIFSEFLVRKNLRLDIPALSTTAEPLLNDHIQIIRKAFGKTPFNWYGSREAGRVATSDKFHDGMYINAYQNHIEPLASSGTVEPGLSRLVLTDLWNIGFPLIRYSTEDMGVLDVEPGQSGCELPRLKRLVGRVADIFVNSKGQRIVGASFVNRILTQSTEVKHIQVIQNGYSEFVIRLVAGPDYHQGTDAALKATLIDFLHDEPDIRVERVDRIELSASGKRRLCIVNFTPEP